MTNPAGLLKYSKECDAILALTLIQQNLSGYNKEQDKDFGTKIFVPYIFGSEKRHIKAKIAMPKTLKSQSVCCGLVPLYSFVIIFHWCFSLLQSVTVMKA